MADSELHALAFRATPAGGGDIGFGLVVRAPRTSGPGQRCSMAMSTGEAI
jgi:hypothetical protein